MYGPVLSDCCFVGAFTFFKVLKRLTVMHYAGRISLTVHREVHAGVEFSILLKDRQLQKKNLYAMLMQGQKIFFALQPYSSGISGNFFQMGLSK